MAAVECDRLDVLRVVVSAELAAGSVADTDLGESLAIIAAGLVSDFDAQPNRDDCPECPLRQKCVASYGAPMAPRSGLTLVRAAAGVA